MSGQPGETLIVVKDNAYGLTRDADLLAGAIADAGGTTRRVPARGRRLLDRLFGRRIAARAIHIERAFPAWYSAAGVNWLVPNQERFPRRHLSRLKGIDLVLAKTRHAEAIFRDLGARTRYLGFTSEDRFDPTVSRDWSGFYHLAGGSTLKGTEALVALWRRHPEWPRLSLVQKRENAPANLPANIELLAGYLSDAELTRLQNAHGVHLCPSLSEGWGHHILEGMACGAVVLTTDAPPMNEHITAGTGILVEASHPVPRHLGFNYHVDPDALEAAVLRILAMSDADKVAMGERAREVFRKIDQGFRARVAELMQEAQG